MSWDVVQEHVPGATSADQIRVIREPFLAERIVFTGGLPGCGKTLMTPIISSLARVEIQKADYIAEYICCLGFLKKLDDDVSTTLIRMLTDLNLYNLMMSRETNFRFSDITSVFRNSGTVRYLTRLFQPGDQAAVERVRKGKPILHILLHNLLVLSPYLFDSLRDRVRIVEIVRHPLYMIKQWHLYIERYGKDERDFGICFDYGGRSLPWFAFGWEEKYLAGNAMDRVIYSIDHLLNLGEKIFQSLSADEKSQTLVIPFEQFILTPWPFLRSLERLLGTEVTRATRRELKRQNVPRKMIADGIPLPIYRQCGWEPPQKGCDEKRELERRRQYAAERASAEAMEVLDRLCRQYEDQYLKGVLT